MQLTNTQRVHTIARALEEQAAEVEGISNRLRACGHLKYADKAFLAGKDLATIAKVLLGGTSEVYNLFFHARAAEGDSSVPEQDGAGVDMPWVKNL